MPSNAGERDSSRRGTYDLRYIEADNKYDFLKEVLLQVAMESPFSGPAACGNINYTYTCSTKGNLNRFQGYESANIKAGSYMNVIIMAEESGRVKC